MLNCRDVANMSTMVTIRSTNAQASSMSRGGVGCLCASLWSMISTVNNYFASVCSHSTYGLDDVLYYYKHHLAPHNNDLTVSVYEVERMLSRMKPSSPGADAVPRWFYHYCSYE